jgi:hypothetical protein
MRRTTADLFEISAGRSQTGNTLESVEANLRLAIPGRYVADVWLCRDFAEMILWNRVSTMFFHAFRLVGQKRAWEGFQQR